MLRFNRKFLMWRYTVGHQQLLLRSVKAEESGTRIDILFKAVKHVCIPTTIEDIVIEEIRSAPGSHPTWASTPDAQMFKVSGKHGEGYVVAGALAHSEDEGEYDSPSKFDDSMLTG